MSLDAVIFDVEGTLIDFVPLVLESSEAALVAAGHSPSRRDLQRYSGMDGAAMLQASAGRGRGREKRPARSAGAPLPKRALASRATVRRGARAACRFEMLRSKASDCNDLQS